MHFIRAHFYVRQIEQENSRISRSIPRRAVDFCRTDGGNALLFLERTENQKYFPAFDRLQKGHLDRRFLSNHVEI